MRLAAISLSVVILAAVCGDHLGACSFPHRPGPIEFTMATPDSEYVLAVVEPVDTAHQTAGAAGNGAISIRSLYPRSGIYRTGAAAELIWALDEFSELFRYLHYHSDEEAIRSFFVRGGKSYLVVSSSDAVLRFYENAELVRRVTRQEVLSAPWHAGAVGPCGSGPQL